MNILKYILVKDNQIGGSNETINRQKFKDDEIIILEQIIERYKQKHQQTEIQHQQQKWKEKNIKIHPINPYGKIYWSFEEFLENNREYIVKTESITIPSNRPQYTFGIDIEDDFKLNFSKLLKKPTITLSLDSSLSSEKDIDIDIEKNLFNLNEQKVQYIQKYHTNVYFKGTFTFIIYDKNYIDLTNDNVSELKKLKEDIKKYITETFDNIDSQYLYFYFQYKERIKDKFHLQEKEQYKLIDDKIIIKIQYIPPNSLVHTNIHMLIYSLEFDFVLSCLENDINLFRSNSTSPTLTPNPGLILGSYNSAKNLVINMSDNIKVIHNPTQSSHDLLIVLLDESIKLDELKMENITGILQQFITNLKINTGIGKSFLKSHPDFFKNFYIGVESNESDESADIFATQFNITQIIENYNNMDNMDNTTFLFKLYKKLIVLIHWSRNIIVNGIEPLHKIFLYFLYYKSIPSVIRTIFLVENKFKICKYMNFIADNLLLVGWLDDDLPSPKKIYAKLGPYELFNFKSMKVRFEKYKNEISSILGPIDEVNIPYSEQFNNYINTYLIKKNAYIDSYATNETLYEFCISSHPLLVSSVTVNNINTYEDLNEKQQESYEELYKQSFVCPLLKKDLISPPSSSLTLSPSPLSVPSQLPSIQDIIYDRKNCIQCTKYAPFYLSYINGSHPYFKFLYQNKLYKEHVYIFINNEKLNCSYILAPDIKFWKSCEQLFNVISSSSPIILHEFKTKLEENLDLMKLGRFQLWLIHDKFRDNFFIHTDKRWYHKQYKHLILLSPSKSLILSINLIKDALDYTNVFEFKLDELQILNEYINKIKYYFSNNFFNNKQLLLSWHIYNKHSQTIPHLRIQPIVEQFHYQDIFIGKYSSIYRHLSTIKGISDTFLMDIILKLNQSSDYDKNKIIINHFVRLDQVSNF